MRPVHPSFCNCLNIFLSSRRCCRCPFSRPSTYALIAVSGGASRGKSRDRLLYRDFHCFSCSVAPGFQAAQPFHWDYWLLVEIHPLLDSLFASWDCRRICWTPCSRTVQRHWSIRKIKRDKNVIRQDTKRITRATINRTTRRSSLVATVFAPLSSYGNSD